MQSPGAIAFSIFGIDVRWYGLLIGIGFILAILISYKRAPRFGIESEHILDFAIWLIPCSIVGARLYYILFRWEYYAGDIGKMLDIRSGGLAIHGGIIAGILVAYFVSRHYKFSFLDLLDVIFPSVALGQAIGRWGNFFNSEAHGTETTLPWAVIIDGKSYHPTFLYESIWCLLLFFLLLYLSRKRKFKGEIFLLYVMLYSFERFFVEGLRTDSLMIGPLRQAQVLSVCAIVVAAVLYAIGRSRARKALTAAGEAAPPAAPETVSEDGGSEE